MLDKVDSERFKLDPQRYMLVKGDSPGAPTCPYGNKYQWVGYDKVNQTFVRFTKSVFKRLINEQKSQ